MKAKPPPSACRVHQWSSLTSHHGQRKDEICCCIACLSTSQGRDQGVSSCTHHLRSGSSVPLHPTCRIPRPARSFRSHLGILGTAYELICVCDASCFFCHVRTNSDSNLFHSHIDCVHISSQFSGMHPLLCMIYGLVLDKQCQRW